MAETPGAPATPEPPRFDVSRGYLIKYCGGCTCVGGGPWPHEEYCGWEQLGPVEDLLTQIEALRAEVAAAEQRGAEEAWRQTLRFLRENRVSSPPDHALRSIDQWLTEKNIPRAAPRAAVADPHTEGG
jgi:hypothetical protein